MNAVWYQEIENLRAVVRALGAWEAEDGRIRDGHGALVELTEQQARVVRRALSDG